MHGIRLKRAQVKVGCKEHRGNYTYLLISNAGEVPDHEPSVSATGRQDGLILGAPANLKDLLRVVVKGVQGLAQIAEIMQRHLAWRILSQKRAPHRHIVTCHSIYQITQEGCVSSNQGTPARMHCVVVWRSVS